MVKTWNELDFNFHQNMGINLNNYCSIYDAFSITTSLPCAKSVIRRIVEGDHFPSSSLAILQKLTWPEE
jgi:hypothetical protein